ncbi:hypothetical protein GN244_ATG04394 [Phytophthora infestans]|uniref:Uncharacterized protein n=1 Tax=Phytophthora infestans TaxID=4787 RepID=A0A833SYH0_PHYIN|nr:hypothetical protein GN244_ATG04394 [Phytophthora infestans]
MDNTPVAAFGEGVETADTAPWAVNALGSPGDGPPPLPLRGTAVLITRVGEPLGRARGGWRSNVEFDIGEGYAVFKEKCIARYEALIAGPEAPKKPLALPGDVSIYFKRTKNDPQAKTNDNSVIFGLKLFSRRIEQARMQRVAYETANAIQFGEITAQHLDVVNARRPEASPFEVPADNTTAQAMELDRQRELLQPQENAARDATQTASVKVRLGGMWVPMEVGYFVASPSNRFTGSRHFFTGYIPRVYAYTTD